MSSVVILQPKIGLTLKSEEKPVSDIDNLQLFAQFFKTSASVSSISQEVSRIVWFVCLNAFYYTNLICMYVVISVEKKLLFIYSRSLLQTKYNEW